ncbi:MAG: MBL fold metallo-hydrolase [Gemmatimonadetes bacterium]|nr:MBL fold metallo-hydrolase [Gemmatimonadota bacterium]MYH51840.1 MBL fold metallo-hydrolase [Gemmatimonadota bacterium]MYK66303.1 MBL fold metallo-hydrolase [Gemmatimonadota bacterium]
MRFSVLGSGSRGNATLIAAGTTRLLVDAGFSARELTKRLATVGVEPAEVTAILVTHEHGDHTRGAGVFARAHGTPLMMTEGTLGACRKLLRGSEEVRTYRAGYPVEVEELEVEPFITVHDAVDPVAVAVREPATGLRLGIATDLGRPTLQVMHALRGCDALVVESNHDESMLWSTSYPASVKARIASSHGHLSNQAATRLVLELLSPRLTVVVLAHLSEESNTPALARSEMERALAKQGFAGTVEVARPDRPTPLLDLGVLREQVGPRQLSFL